MKAILRSAESNLDALSTVYLGPKRPLSVGECELWARVAVPRLAAQVDSVSDLDTESYSNIFKNRLIIYDICGTSNYICIFIYTYIFVNRIK